MSDNGNNICFTGDLIFGDQPATFGYGANSTWEGRSYRGLFKYTGKILKSAGVTVANFECTISDDIPPANRDLNNYMMCCKSTVCRELYDNNIRIVSVANNHTFDYGPEGYAYTVDCLTKNGISVIGDRKKPYMIVGSSGEGGSVAIIGCSYLKVKHYADAPYLLNPTADEWKAILNEIKGKADHIIAYVHWGNEFVKNPTKSQTDIADELIALGIDDIIGCHSHILQAKQSSDGHTVYYSLGNFVSDYWQRRLRYSVILKFDPVSGNFREIPCYIDSHFRPHMLNTAQDLIPEACGRTDNLQIFLNRNRMRMEYLVKMAANFGKVKGKAKLFKWVLERIGYFAKNMIQEIRDPNVVYQKFEVKQ